MTAGECPSGSDVRTDIPAAGARAILSLLEEYAPGSSLLEERFPDLAVRSSFEKARDRLDLALRAYEARKHLTAEEKAEKEAKAASRSRARRAVLLLLRAHPDGLSVRDLSRKGFGRALLQNMARTKLVRRVSVGGASGWTLGEGA